MKKRKKYFVIFEIFCIFVMLNKTNKDMKKKQMRFTDREQTLIELAVAEKFQQANEMYESMKSTHKETDPIVIGFKANRDELQKLYIKVVKSEIITRTFWEDENK